MRGVSLPTTSVCASRGRRPRPDSVCRLGWCASAAWEVIDGPPVCTVRRLGSRAATGRPPPVGGGVAGNGRTPPQTPPPSPRHPLRSGAVGGPQLPPLLICAGAPETEPTIARSSCRLQRAKSGADATRVGCGIQVIVG